MSEIKTIIEHIVRDKVRETAESNNTGLTKEKVNTLVDKLGKGMAIAANQVNPNENLIIMGNEILKAIITSVGKQDDDELFVYTIEQLLIKIPFRAREVLEIVSEKYPKYKEFVDKLIILV